MSNKIVIAGAGGFGREVLGWAQERMFSSEIKGFLSDNPKALDGYNIKVPIIGTIDDYKIEEEDSFIIAVGYVDTRKSISDRLSKRGARFHTFIHDTAIISKTAKIGLGCVIGPYCIVSDHVELGKFVMMSFYSSCGHDAKVGDYSILSPYATVNGFTVLGSGVFMGTHSSVAARLTVGEGSSINSGSAAMYTVPERSFVFGVPGKNQVIFNKA
jgi:sugar O-acyltransferase (sialic acid O-acetyltransferase NeuD family)